MKRLTESVEEDELSGVDAERVQHTVDLSARRITVRHCYPSPILINLFNLLCKSIEFGNDHFKINTERTSLVMGTVPFR